MLSVNNFVSQGIKNSSLIDYQSPKSKVNSLSSNLENSSKSEGYGSLTKIALGLFCSLPILYWGYQNIFKEQIFL